MCQHFAQALYILVYLLEFQHRNNYNNTLWELPFRNQVVRSRGTTGQFDFFKIVEMFIAANPTECIIDKHAQ